MSGANTPDCNTTIAGDADYLTEVIDCCGRAGAVARQRWEFLHGAVRLPDHRPELQDLESSIASWIMDPVFCPPDHLTDAIRALGERKRRKTEETEKRQWDCGRQGPEIKKKLAVESVR